jgi:hypothetical protein
LNAQVKCNASEAGELEKYMYHSIAEILYEEHWCEGIEPTNLEDKFLILITKSHLAASHQFLDKGLQEMWNYISEKDHDELPKYPDYPVPIHEYHNTSSTAMSSYANAL